MVLIPRRLQITLWLIWPALFCGNFDLFFQRFLPKKSWPEASVRLAPSPNCHTLKSMKTPTSVKPSISGRIPLLLLWFIGIPVPILIIIFLLRGCT
jgi:hypothetical protein